MFCTFAPDNYTSAKPYNKRLINLACSVRTLKNRSDISQVQTEARSIKTTYYMVGTTSGEMERSDWLRPSTGGHYFPVMDRSITGSGLHQQMFRTCFYQR